jgi:hypothetical protein
VARFSSLRDVDTHLAALDPGTALPGAWTLAQAFAHCADSIEGSLRGYPKLKPAIVRWTIGPIVKRRFLARGAMKHNLAAPLPGAEAPADGEAAAAIARLRTTIARFAAHDGPLSPHPVYGACTKAEYDALHAMHIADHLGA